MSETAPGKGFSLQSALQALEQATRYEEPLRHRTEGVTWMLWGVVAVGIFLSYDLAAARFDVQAWPACPPTPS